METNIENLLPPELYNAGNEYNKLSGGIHMSIKQISVFLENKKGRLLAVTRCLYDNNINIRALSVADTTDFGILRMIVDRPELAYEALKKNGFTVRDTDVIAIEIPDDPGGLYHALEVLEKGDINLEYVYAFVDARKGAALNVIRVDKMDEATEILKNGGIKIVANEELSI